VPIGLLRFYRLWIRLFSTKLDSPFRRGMRGKQKAERLLLGTSACELDLVLVLDQVCDSTAAGSQVGFGSPMHLSCAPFLDRISTYGLLGTSVRAESRQVF